MALHLNRQSIHISPFSKDLPRTLQNWEWFKGCRCLYRRPADSRNEKLRL